MSIVMHILLVDTLGYLCLCHYTPKKEMKRAPDDIKKTNLKLYIKKSKINLQNINIIQR